jgi:hypothetical protein
VLSDELDCDLADGLHVEHEGLEVRPLRGLGGISRALVLSGDVVLGSREKASGKGTRCESGTVPPL